MRSTRSRPCGTRSHAARVSSVLSSVSTPIAGGVEAIRPLHPHLLLGVGVAIVQVESQRHRAAVRRQRDDDAFRRIAPISTSQNSAWSGRPRRAPAGRSSRMAVRRSWRRPAPRWRDGAPGAGFGCGPADGVVPREAARRKTRGPSSDNGRSRVDVDDARYSSIRGAIPPRPDDRRAGRSAPGIPCVSVRCPGTRPASRWSRCSSSASPRRASTCTGARLHITPTPSGSIFSRWSRRSARQPLLNLQAAREDVDEPRHLGQADDHRGCRRRGTCRRTAAGGARRGGRTRCPSRSPCRCGLREERLVDDLVDVHVVAAREEPERLFDARFGVLRSPSRPGSSPSTRQGAARNQLLHVKNCTRAST